jgi:hypothetical protein
MEANRESMSQVHRDLQAELRQQQDDSAACLDHARSESHLREVQLARSAQCLEAQLRAKIHQYEHDLPALRQRILQLKEEYDAEFPAESQDI